VGGSRDTNTQALINELRSRYVPQCLVAMRSPHTPPHRSPHLAEIFRGRDAGSQTTAYVCQRFTCQAPVSGSERMRELWERLSRTQA
jgi:uncharacterized protein YyaL (SSP411 family)